MWPEKYAVPDAWQPSVLAGLLGLSRLIRRPVASWKVERAQWRQLRSHTALRRRGILPLFKGYPDHAFPPRYEDLYGIYLALVQRKPAVVLELGGGYSTIVIAQAVSELAAGGHQTMFYSVDESAEWQQVQQDHLPGRLAPFVRFHHAPSRVVEWKGEAVCSFESLPVSAVNLLYVDGGAVGGNKRGVDAVLLESTSPLDFTVLVDGRPQTVALLRQHLVRRYRVGPGPNGVQTMFVPERR